MSSIKPQATPPVNIPNVNVKTPVKTVKTPIPGAPVKQAQLPEYHMRALSDFTNVQEPRVEGRGGQDIKNVQDLGGGAVRFRLRIGQGWWDGDGAGGTKGGRQDRQRAECRGLGAVMQRSGETWEYGTTFRVSVPFKTWDGALTSVMQIIPPRGLEDPNVEYLPVVFVQLTSDHTGEVFAIGGNTGVRTVRTFAFAPGQWTALSVRLHVDTHAGSAEVSVNGDAYKGVGGNVARGAAKAYDAKWGFYRHFSDPKKVCDDYVEHKNVYRKRLA